MKKIIGVEDKVLNLYPNIEETNLSDCVLSKYTIIEQVEDGYLLYHTITRSMFFLTNEEFLNILNNNSFKDNKILINKSIDEDIIAKNAYLTRSEINFDKQPNITGYVIFTTNLCNADCAYCYEKEKNLPQENMSIETAEDVVKFMLKNYKGKRLNLIWFGGEPLLNTKVIDYITERLTEEKVLFTSHISTNGLLFNDINIDKAINKWGLSSAQITIDDIGDAYNNIKSYKNIKYDAFKILEKNISKILDTGLITVNIRINVDENNINHLDDIFAYFYEKYDKKIKQKKIKVYTHILFQILTDDNKISHEFYEKLIRTHLKFNKPFFSRNTVKHNTLSFCMADRRSAISINTQGKLSLCEHWDDDNVIGTIYDGITNDSLINEWSIKTGDNIAYCTQEKCKYLPMCLHYNKCYTSFLCKNKKHLDIMNFYYREMIKWTYYDYKLKNGEE